MNDTITAEHVVQDQMQAGMFLTFMLNDETYGIEILKVQEIIGLTKVTEIPRTPDFVRGVINLRGKVIPVTDLRLKFGLQSQEDTERTCIIVVEIDSSEGPVTTGIIVDQVAEVVDIAVDQMEPPPSFGSAIDTAFIMAMGKIGDRVAMLLDVDKVMSNEELSSLNTMAQQE